MITGGAGYLGSVLTPKLLNAGHEIKVLDNFIYNNETTLANLAQYSHFSVHKVDCRDTQAVRSYLAWPDVIIPLAGLVGEPICNQNPLDAELLNLKAPIDLFKNLSRNQLVIMPTTESSYGKNEDICTEDTPLNPLSTYAKHKVTVEQALLERENAISLRLATVFGMSPRMRLDLLINDFVWRAQKDRAFVVFEGKYRRTCTHIQDVTDAIIYALNHFQEGIYNVGSITVSKISLCETIKEYVPNFTYVEKDYLKDTDQRDYVVSSAKLLETGFKFNIDLEHGIEELLKGYNMLSNNVYGNV